MYKFSAKIRYALIALCDIIIYSKKKAVPLTDIVRRQQIPRVYAEQILSKLVKNEILKSRKGPLGGFILNKKPQDISLYKLYQLLHPENEKKQEIKELKNQKVKLIMDKTVTLFDQQFIELLKGIKLNIIPGILKPKK